MEEEALRADPRVLGVVLAVMEDFAVQSIVSIIAGFLAIAVEFGLGKQQAQSVGLLLLQFLFQKLVLKLIIRIKIY